MSLSLGFKCNSLTRQKLVDRTVIAIGLGLKAETKELQWHKRVHQNSREWCQTPGLVPP